MFDLYPIDKLMTQYLMGYYLRESSNYSLSPVLSNQHNYFNCVSLFHLGRSQIFEQIPLSQENPLCLNQLSLHYQDLLSLSLLLYLHQLHPLVTKKAFQDFILNLMRFIAFLNRWLFTSGVLSNPSNFLLNTVQHFYFLPQDQNLNFFYLDHNYHAMQNLLYCYSKNISKVTVL